MAQKSRTEAERMVEVVEEALSGVLRSIASRAHAAQGSVLFPAGITRIKLDVTVSKLGSFGLEVSGPDRGRIGRVPELGEREEAMTKDLEVWSGAEHRVLARGPVDPDHMKEVAQELVESGNYNPVGNTTKCNFFLNDFASRVFGYDGFTGLVANQIVDMVIDANDDWAPLFDQNNGGSVQTAFATAQEQANAGYFAIVGTRAKDGQPGHVAVVVPGQLTPSGKWAQLAPQGVPMIAQAGTRVFADDKLSEGFRPYTSVQERFVVGLRGANALLAKTTFAARRAAPSDTAPRTRRRRRPASSGA